MPLQEGEGPVGLVICPSRELARQTHAITMKHAQALAAAGWPETRHLLCVGGEDIRSAGAPLPLRSCRKLLDRGRTAVQPQQVSSSSTCCITQTERQEARGRDQRNEAVAEQREGVGAGDMLRRGVHTAVCTPGRLKDFLEKRRMNLDICRCCPPPFDLVFF
jgi:hypothetical protein